MSRIGKIGLAAVVLPAMLAGAADDFTRYQVILDKMPFGKQPFAGADAAADAAKAAAAAAESFTKPFKMVAIKVNPNGVIKVGFIDTAKGNKSYYLSVGEKSGDGIELVSADYDRESAVLKKDAETGFISMKGNTPSPGSGPAGGAFAVANAGGPMAAGRRGGHSQGWRGREPFRHLQVEGHTMTKDELDTHIKSHQMDVIRQGLPPLPVPLTKEMDDQLVSEGVLPPLEPGTSPAEAPDEGGRRSAKR